MTRLAAPARLVALLAAVLAVVALSARHLAPVPDLVLVLVVAWALLRGPLVGGRQPVRGDVERLEHVGRPCACL